MTVAALVTAGGTGVRMGGDTPKQYLDLCGIPILARTLTVFENHPLVELIVVTVPPGDEEFCKAQIIEPFKIRKAAEIVAGGRTRQASVYNGLCRLRESSLIAIHDGVRPLVSGETVTRTIEAAYESGAAVACLRVRDTVKRQAGEFLQTISRSDLWLAHTPQAFRTGLILRAHEKAMEQGFDGTDDSVLVELLGHPVTVVEDSEDNLKITTPADLERAKLLIKGLAGV
jgi:2-C-methyl-D-erythritol 4-phosphate cytidylyltransferase